MTFKIFIHSSNRAVAFFTLLLHQLDWKKNIRQPSVLRLKGLIIKRTELKKNKRIVVVGVFISPHFLRDLMQ